MFSRVVFMQGSYFSLIGPVYFPDNWPSKSKFTIYIHIPPLPQTHPKYKIKQL